MENLKKRHVPDIPHDEIYATMLKCGGVLKHAAEEMGCDRKALGRRVNTDPVLSELKSDSP